MGSSAQGVLAVLIALQLAVNAQPWTEALAALQEHLLGCFAGLATATIAEGFQTALSLVGKGQPELPCLLVSIGRVAQDYTLV